MKRIAPSTNLGQQLAELLQGGFSQENKPSELRSTLIRLGIQRLLQEMLEAEQRDFLGVERYQRGESRQGQRNGYEASHMVTGEGRIDLQAPQVRGSEQAFQSRWLQFLRGRTEVVERLVSEMYPHANNI